MDRPKIRTVAACGLTLLLAVAGCRNLPSRRIPPEPPYPGAEGAAGFGSAPSPAMDYGAGGAGYGNAPGMGAAMDPYAGAAGTAGAASSPYGSYDQGGFNGPAAGAAEPGGAPAAGVDGSTGGLPNPGMAPASPDYNMGSPGAGPSPY